MAGGTKVKTGAAAADVVVPVTHVDGVFFQRTGEAEQAGDAGSGALADTAFAIPPLQEIQLRATLSGFDKPPAAARFEVFATLPPPTGGKPVATVNATTKTAIDARATWKLDPKVHKLAADAFVRATADKATPFVAHVKVDNQGSFNLRFDGAPRLVRPGVEVTLACDTVGFASPISATFEVSNALEPVFGGAAGPAPKVLASVAATESKGGKLTGKWTVALPDDVAGKAPSATQVNPLPGVRFVVKIGTTRAVSPVQAILPDLELALEPGDPNWLMEPIVERKKSAVKAGEADPAGGAVVKAADPDKDGGKFPNRVLGIKQRLQALGFYYETLPPLADKAGRNRQTRVFRKCVKWYWRHVNPADPKKPVPLTDEPGYDPAKDKELPPRGKSVIDVAKLGDDWLLALEDSVRQAVVLPEPAKPDDVPTPGPVDFTQEARLVFPGDMCFTNQEKFQSTAPVDWTFQRTDKPYDVQTGGLGDAPSAAHPDYRHATEELVYQRNPAIGRVPVVARVKMKLKGGTFPGPDSGLRVLFQLVAVPGTTADPPYLGRLGLRTFTRRKAKTLVNAVPGKTAHGPGADDKGPRSYLKQVHAFVDTDNADESDPTHWNAPEHLGGKRSKKLRVAGTILPVGKSAAALAVPDVASFPWSAEDATTALPAHAAAYKASISVPVVGGTAAIVFAPSRRGGDTYSLRAFVDAPRAPGATPASPPPKPVVETTTKPLTVWRRIRITRYFSRGAPASWVPDADGNDPVDEFQGGIDPIEWARVRSIYAKAFLVIEAPAKPEPLDTALRDRAVKGAIGHFQRLCAGKPVSYAAWLRRNGRAGVLPLFDISRIAKTGVDSPNIFDWNHPDEYDAARDPKTAAAGTFPASRLYAHDEGALIGLASSELFGWFNIYLDADEPSDAADYDAVPAPGVTCVQAFCGDSYTLQGGATDLFAYLAAPLRGGKTLVARNDALFEIGRASPDRSWVDPSAAAHLVEVRYTTEHGGLCNGQEFYIHPANAADPNGRLASMLNTFRSTINRLNTIPDATGSPDPAKNPVASQVALPAGSVTNPAVADGRIVFEIGPTDPQAGARMFLFSNSVDFKVTPDNAAAPTSWEALATSAVKKGDGTPADAATLLSDLAGFDAAKSCNVSIRRDDGTIDEGSRSQNAPFGTLTLGDLVNRFGEIGAKTHEVGAGGIVHLSLPSTRKSGGTPTLEFRNTNMDIGWYAFRHEVVAGKHRFTSEGQYWKIHRTLKGTGKDAHFEDAAGATDVPDYVEADDPKDPVHPKVENLGLDLGKLVTGISLTAGDKANKVEPDVLHVIRYRATAVQAAVAKVPVGENRALRVDELPIWKEVTFRYGPKPDFDGTTLKDLFDLVRAKKAALERTKDELELRPAHRFVLNAAGKKSEPTWFFWKQRVLDRVFTGDGLVFAIAVERGTTKKLVDASWMPFVQRGQTGSLTSSGISTAGRAFFLFWGKNFYNSVGVTGGADPKGGRGAAPPHGLCFYEHSSNAAHELGHVLGLRHHWTGNRSTRLAEHDHDDLCHMGYFTSFAERAAGNEVRVPPDVLLGGNERAECRGEPCGRCLLKLRGWHMGRDAGHLPANVPAKTSFDDFPAAFPSNFRDWDESAETPPGPHGGGGGDVPPPTPKHVACHELAGGHFDFDSAFVRPDGVQALGAVSSDLGGDANRLALVYGHTDTVGGESYNKALSERRARAVVCVLTGDADGWEELYQKEHWGLKKVQVMLNAVRAPDEATIAEDGIPGPETSGAIKRFQARDDHAPLPSSGAADHDTRHELFLAYMKLGAPSPLSPVRFHDFAGSRFMGCGVYNPYAEKGADEASRRVVIMVHDAGSDPGALPCKVGDLAPCRANLSGGGPSEGDAGAASGSVAHFRCKVYRRLQGLCMAPDPGDGS